MSLDMQWYTQDGAKPHTANKVFDVLHTSGACVSPQRYPDSHNCNHFLGHLSAPSRTRVTSLYGVS
jgi:hypothetical protein